ncbi:hypothetical protein MSG28_005950 [Choristoneura fumiferana]|uniref:Uncharacterized protein n=1 Tax=Choristoneura fumiferana TaxID=7141 RepID=A0ACC0L1P0_CHOFU|nr:hypothetical protein MSG28_005950 [Choristoneura fumiferana]
MLGNPIRCCCHARHLSPNVFDITNSNLKNFIAGFGTHKACCSKDKGCSNVPQTENRNIEPWPKPDPPPPSWRCECPRDPQPVNYDPYRIKVPEIVVPPLPGGEAKWTGVVFTTTGPGQQTGEEPGVLGQKQSAAPQGMPPAAKEDDTQQEGFFTMLKNLLNKAKKGRGRTPMSTVDALKVQIHYELPTDAAELFKNACVTFGTDPNFAPLRDLFQNSPVVHPDYWKEQPTKKQLADPLGEAIPRLGYHGRNKYKFAFHEPWKPLDRMTLLEQAEKEENELSTVTGAVATAEKEA